MCEMCVIMSTLVIHLLPYILRRLTALKFSIFGVEPREKWLISWSTQMGLVSGNYRPLYRLLTRSAHLGCVKESENKRGSIRLKIKGGEGGREGKT